jgi:alkylated DNA repair dioxygenase AlkB
LNLTPFRSADQPGLFAEERLPRGLMYRTGFVDAAEERALLEAFAALPFTEALFQQYTAKRRVVRFGSIYDEEERRWIDGPPLPEYLVALRTRAAEWLGVAPESFVHALVTEYRTGTPIGWHRDKPHYGSVVGISLASACRMRFRPLAAKQDRHAAIALDLAPRSAYAMQDEIRWQWQHHIPPTKSLRYSITFRTRAELTPDCAAPATPRSASPRRSTSPS